MMKKLLLLFAVFFGMSLFSCDKVEDSTCSEDEIAESYICRERDPNYPLILSRPRERTVTRTVELGFDDILGRSFKLDYFPFENLQNVSQPVINLAKLEADKPAWVTKIPLRQSNSTAFSYSTFDRYEENSTTTKKVNSGFQLNLGIFKIGNKNTYYEHFASSLIQNSNSVFGQLDIEIKDAVYNLAVNSNRLNEIRKDYIEQDFVDDLYNLPPQEMFSFYGSFVMSNFITGGRATALFAGITKTETIGEAREQTMDSEISASFTFKKNEDSDNTTSGSISLGFGKGFTNGSSSTQTFTQLNATLMTYGGNYGLGAFTTPRSIDNMNVDLTAWVNSLNNKDTHALVDIQDNGLIPLSGFFIEANLNAQYKKYVAGEDLPSKTFVEPRLVHQYHPVGTLFYNSMYLITRFNDAILIRFDIFERIDTQTKAELDAKFDELCTMYRIKAEKNSKYLDRTLFNSYIRIEEQGIYNGTFQEGAFLEPKMKQYYDANSEMLYLLYNENGKKVGYAIYMGKGDYLLDTYAIRHWVGVLPTTTVSDQELLNYTLIAL